MKINKQTMLFEELIEEVEKIELFRWAESAVLRDEYSKPYWVKEWMETFEYDIEQQLISLMSTVLLPIVLLSVAKSYKENQIHQTRKYYKSNNHIFNNIEVINWLGSTTGNYTFIPNNDVNHCWIRTEDLFDTEEDAKRATVARFLPC